MSETAPKRILIVEDHRETRDMIEAVLREAGYAGRRS